MRRSKIYWESFNTGATTKDSPTLSVIELALYLTSVSREGLPRRNWYQPDPVQHRFKRDQPFIDAIHPLLLFS